MKNRKDNAIDLMPNISRRDFVGGTLVGIGAALLTAPPPLRAAGRKPVGVFDDPWTGFGGVGDYARANGNVASVRDAAHLILEGNVPQLLEEAEDTGEVFDMVIVGGGFSGVTAAYQFHKQFGDAKKCLILDNHAVFGGEAKQNEFDVDGYYLYGPQGSAGFLPPIGNSTLNDEIFRTVGMPMEYQFVESDPSRTLVKAPLDNYDSMYWGEKHFDTGYFFGTGSNNGWVVNPWEDRLARTPWQNDFKQDLLRVYEEKKRYHSGEDYDRWLDSMTYQEYLVREMGLSPEIARFFDPLIAVSDFGLSADVISAYAAHLLFLPGTTAYGSPDEFDLTNLPAIYSFPGGNTAYLRHIVKYIIPDSIKGGKSFEEILNNPIAFAALDRPDKPIRIHLNATALDVSHAGPADSADHVNVTYYQQGKVRRVKARTVVMSIGGWVARKIVSDMPAPIRAAYNEFRHGPVLVVNVALRNWRFLDRLGIAAARSFEGLGTFCSIRRPMEVGKSTLPFDPDKPTVLTFHVPFNYPGNDIKVQGTLGRTELLSKSYAQYEQQIINQMNKMFAPSGFDAQRDVAGIVLNRWGHAYVSPQPGFYFGRNGNPAPKDVVKAGFGRIQFGHSELGARMNYRNAMAEGGRAAEQALKII